MSRNLKKSSFQFEDDLDLDRSWNEMCKILDEKMPVEKKGQLARLWSKTSSKVALLVTGIMIMGTIFYFSLIPNVREGNAFEGLITKVEQPDMQRVEVEKEEDSKNGFALQEENPLIGSLAVNRSGQNKKRKYSPSDFEIRKSGLVHISAPQLVIPNDIQSNSPENAITINSGQEVSNRSTVSEIPDIIMDDRIKNMLSSSDKLILNDSHRPSSMGIKNNEQTLKRRSIGLQLSVLHNLTGTPHSVYPMATILFPLNPKAHISLGVGLNAPVKLDNVHPKNFMVLNDTINQRFFTVERNIVKNATYMDIPVAFHYKVSDHFSLNAGVQLSFLHDVDIKTDKVDYDFQADLFEELALPLFATPGSYIPNQSYTQHLEVLKSNVRFISGFDFMLNKDLGFTFKYQHSLTPNYNLTEFSGNKKEKRLSVFSVGLSYQIK